MMIPQCFVLIKQIYRLLESNLWTYIVDICLLVNLCKILLKRVILVLIFNSSFRLQGVTDTRNCMWLSEPLCVCFQDPQAPVLVLVCYFLPLLLQQVQMSSVQKDRIS